VDQKGRGSSKKERKIKIKNTPLAILMTRCHRCFKGWRMNGCLRECAHGMIEIIIIIVKQEMDSTLGLFGKLDV